ncbi:AAA family ATPase [Arenimonas sp. MALMAid1274]|uniref:AAA family ATPase n=1 Tax=Arenimonas sp. MALMAid1274 TaxID=3411630 RepID=UPI003B9DE21F
MKLVSMTCHRYRAFKERYKTPIAPITIIIGKNGSGKSVLARLPLLLSRALASDPDNPLDLFAGGVEHAVTFEDLIHARSALPFALGAEFYDGHTRSEFETTLVHISELKILVIEKFELKEQGETVLQIELEDPSQLTSQRPMYRVTSDGTTTVSAVRFSGLLPEPTTVGAELGHRLERLFMQFRDALSSPSYLGPFRSEGTRAMRVPNQNMRELGARGEKTLEFLADDRLRRGGKLSASVSEWFTTAMGHAIDVDVSGEQPRISISDISMRTPVALSDTGAGFSQSLPIVVQHIGFQHGRLSAPVLIVEQPELHLHPAAHGALADLAVASATSTNPSPAICIIETHSEQLVMRVRRRIAEGVIPADKVIVLSVGHVEVLDGETVIDPIRVITFDTSGNPSSWPTGVFEEAFSDLTELRKATRDKNS